MSRKTLWVVLRDDGKSCRLYAVVGPFDSRELADSYAKSVAAGCDDACRVVQLFSPEDSD